MFGQNGATKNCHNIGSTTTCGASTPSPCGLATAFGDHNLSNGICIMWVEFPGNMILRCVKGRKAQFHHHVKPTVTWKRQNMQKTEDRSVQHNVLKTNTTRRHYGNCQKTLNRWDQQNNVFSSWLTDLTNLAKQLQSGPTVLTLVNWAKKTLCAFTINNQKSWAGLFTVHCLFSSQ